MSAADGGDHDRDRLDQAALEQALGPIEPTTGDKSGPGTLTRGGPPDLAAVEADVILKALRILGRVQGALRSTSMGPGFDVRCPWSAEHSDRIDAGAVYVPIHGRFQCFHGHCENHRSGDIRARVDQLLREDSGGLVSLASLEFDDDVDVETTPVPGPQDWKQRWLVAGKQATPVSNFANVLVALNDAPELAGAFGFNAFALRETLHRELPGVESGTTPGVPRAWRDVDTGILLGWLQHQGLLTISPKMVNDAVNTIMHARSYHPVRDWLAGLVWDKKSRLDTWIAKYLGAPADAYHAHVGRWWLMTMCRRVFEPGCRADYMPVIEGPQGQEKSTALRVLAGAWFSDQLPDITTKDVSEHIIGRWLIEVAEMDRFDRTESAAMKAFVSRTTERYRRPYAMRTADEPRQGVFVGTVNHQSYFKDETGNRRYWPVTAGIIDVTGLSQVRDQLFAEAWHRAITLNEAYWPDTMFEELVMRPEQERRLEADPWEVLVVSYLAGKDQVFIHDVIVAVTGGGSAQLNTTNRNRVTRIMETLRWHRSKTQLDGKKLWCPD